MQGDAIRQTVLLLPLIATVPPLSMTGRADNSKFYEQIRGKELKAGQIQFWNTSDPHRSPNAEQAKFPLFTFTLARQDANWFSAVN